MTEIIDAPLDGREDIVLNLDREELYKLMLYAHEQDITLNQFIEQALREFLEHHKLPKND